MKKNHFESQVNEEQENLNKKLLLLARIQNFNASDEVNNDLAQIDAFKKEWSSIGFVPRNEKEKIGHLYDDAIKACLKKLKVDAAQLEEIKFNSLVSNIKSNPAASDMIRAERMKLKEELNKLENSISQKENNLLFFAKSKNANSLLDDVKVQLEKEKQTAQALKDKIKKLQ